MRLYPVISLLLASVLATPLAAQSTAFTIVGWGDNSFGQLAIPSTATEVSQVAAGDGHALALRSDGKVIAWGRNDAGQRNIPSVVASASIVWDVAAGARHSFASGNFGLVSWGAVTAVPAVGGYKPLAIAAGGDFNLALTMSGSVLAAGGNAYGQTNVPASAQSDVVAIAAGEGHALALKADGTVVAWGKNDFGQATVPASAIRIFAIVAGKNFSAALRLDGVVMVWGQGADSYLLPPPTAGGASKIAAGDDFIVAQTDTGFVGWGAGAAATAIPSDLTDATTLVAGSHFALAVRAPYFTQLPGVVFARPGESATLTAAVSHTTGLTVGWDNFNPPVGGLTLPFTNLTSSRSGAYTITATYATGYTMSATGILVVLVLPNLTNVPTAAIGRENGSATLGFDVSGSGPFSFQWSRNGVPVSGATSRYWAIQPVKPSDAGAYTCTVTNAAGSVTTNPITLTVLPALNGREEMTSKAMLGDRVVLRAQHWNLAPPFTGYSWKKDGVTIPGANGPELIINPYQAADAGAYEVFYTWGIGYATSERPWLETYRGTGPTYIAWLSPRRIVLPPGTGGTVTVNLREAEAYPDLSFDWQIDRAGVTSHSVGVGLTSVTFDVPTTPNIISMQVFADNFITRGQYALAGIFVLDQATTPGFLVKQDGPTKMRVGRSATLLAEFAGPITSTVWTKGGVVIPGQTGSTLTLNNVTAADAGLYTVTVRGAFGSNYAEWPMEIIDPPHIVVQPQGGSLDNGAVELSLTMSQDSPSGYPVQWFRNGEEFWWDRGSGLARQTVKLSVVLPGTYTARVYLTEDVELSQPAVVTAGTGSGGNVAVRPPPGVYLDSRGAAYVRSDRTIVIAARSDGRKVGWFGETVLDANGSFTVPQALRVVADDEPLALDASLPLAGQISSSGELRAFLGPIDGQTMWTGINQNADRKHEGFYRGKLTGTLGGEIWIFVTADDRANVYLQDGFAIYAFDSLNATTSLSFSTDGNTVTYGAYPFGPFIAVKEGTASGGIRLANLSLRALAGEGEDTLITGIVVEGTQPRPVLVRAVGPTLADYGVNQPLADPTLRFFDAEGRLIAENADWTENATELRAAFTRLGAFPLREGSRDAAALMTLTPGVYTAHIVIPPGSSPGEALLETYDDGGTSTAAKLSNLSCRILLRPGETAIQGFVVTGSASKRLLLRAIGPGLRPYGLTNTLTDPFLRLAKEGTTVKENDNWSQLPDDTAAGATMAAMSGAFPLPLGSRDSVLTANLAPGIYTALVTGGSPEDSGVALIEIYEVP